MQQYFRYPQPARCGRLINLRAIPSSRTVFSTAQLVLETVAWVAAGDPSAGIPVKLLVSGSRVGDRDTLSRPP